MDDIAQLSCLIKRFLIFHPFGFLSLQLAEFIVTNPLWDGLPVVFF